MDGTVQRLESGAESGLDSGNFDVGGSHQILIDFSLQGDDLPRFLPAQFPVDLKNHFFVALEVQVESQGGQWPKRTKIRLDSGVVRKFLFFDVRIVCGMEPNIFDGNLLGNSVWNQQCGILDLSVRSSGNTRRRISWTVECQRQSVVVLRLDFDICRKKIPLPGGVQCSRCFSFDEFPLGVLKGKTGFFFVQGLDFKGVGGPVSHIFYRNLQEGYAGLDVQWNAKIRNLHRHF